MKKIMFDNHYGLEDAVLNGTKTMTRRIIKGRFEDVKAYHANGGWHFIADTEDGDSIELKPHYETCEIVAIAQCYEDAILSVGEEEWNKLHKWYCIENLRARAGLHNKMFVRSDLMPHQIQITDVRVERLHDITDEDCLKEGIYAHTVDLDETPGVHPYTSYAYDARVGSNIKRWWYETPREAFHQLVCKLSGKKVWDNNPYVFVYSFKLIK